MMQSQCHTKALKEIGICAKTLARKREPRLVVFFAVTRRPRYSSWYTATRRADEVSDVAKRSVAQAPPDLVSVREQVESSESFVISSVVA